MARAPDKDRNRPDDSPTRFPTIGELLTRGLLQPITSSNDDDVKPQESHSKSKHNSGCEGDEQSYQVVDSDCDVDESESGGKYSDLSNEWVIMEPFTFVTSTQVDFPVHVKICTLEGKHKPIPFSELMRSPELRHIPSNTNPNSDVYCTVQLWADSKPLGVQMQTAYKYFKNSRTWNEWLKMPMTIKDLPYTAQLAITVWDLSPFSADSTPDHRIPFGGTTIPLFDEKDGTLKKGRQKCKIYRHKGADGFSSTTTPSTPAPKRRKPGSEAFELSPEEKELERLEGLFKQHELGEIPRVDWLDKMVFEAVGKIKKDAEEAAKRRQILAQASKNKEGAKSGDESDEETDEENFVLYIEFPRFDLPIVWSDFEYPPPPVSSHPQQTLSGSNATLKPPPEIRLGPGIEGGSDDGQDRRIIRIYDPEVGQKGNPCEDKHRRLVRSHRTNVVDRDLKPNSKYRDDLNVIMSYGPTHELNSEEKDLVWKFRYHLTRDKRALTKFIKSVNWRDVSEATQAVELLPRWTEIDVDDALELLGPTFDNVTVRAYAVDRLRKADDDELLLYLLQLVQALKFEKVEDEATEDATQDSSLAKFLISRAANNFTLGNYFHWYLMVECDDANPGSVSAHRKLFARVEYYFMTELEKIHPEHRKILLRQGELIAVLSKISKDIRFSRDSRPLKIDALKRCLQEPKNDLVTIDPPLPLPLDPDVLVTGCFPEEANVFKSSLSPLLINFKTSEGGKYPFIFKFGDDLRQDQLVIQIISLLDRLLRKENLDLKLTPYRILATSSNAGAAQFIPSISLSAACQKYKGSILAYLKANNPDDNELYGVRKEAMDNYIKSCAGYCVITYLLGVGDRHLDNLLLSPDGHFFHADFGFILGRDPKPFAPMMKLCREMVDGMGGDESPYYLQFKQYCFTVYTTLRRSANLILNLFGLMVDANIPDIRVEPDKAVLKVKERFHLEMSEEEAIRHFEQLITDSSNAIFGAVIDRIHDLMQGWRQ